MKEQILDVAAQLIQRYGLKKFTVDEIASDLKISKKTIYQHFSSKDEIVKAYFETSIESDKDNIQQGMESQKTYLGKIHAIVYSSHKYRLSVPLLNEAKQYYPDVWKDICGLKQFKLDALQNLLEQAAAEGVIKPDIHFGVLIKMLDELSDMFLDYDFLIENKLKTTEAIDAAINIIVNGILK